MTIKNKEIKVICNKCGEEFYTEGNFNGQVSHDDNVTLDWVHEFEEKGIGYGSKLDMCSLKFHLCDDCLFEILKSFEINPRIIDKAGGEIQDKYFD